LKVGVYLADLDRSRTDSQGIINYARDMLGPIQLALNPCDELVILANSALLEEIETSSCRVTVLKHSGSRFRRLWLDNVAMVRWAKKESLDVLHLPKGMSSPAVRFLSAKLVATVHDDIPKQYFNGGFPYLGSRLKLAIVVAQLHQSLKRAAVVLTDSEFSREQLSGWEPQCASRIQVVPPSLSRTKAAASKAEPPYALLFTSELPHKRSAETIELVGPILLRFGVSLLAVGSRRPPSGYITDWVGPAVQQSVLDSLVGAATLLVFGSAYEGFGLPPIEAWLQGTPALVAAERPMTDHLAGFPGLFNFQDPLSCESAIVDLLGLDGTEIERLARALRERFTDGRVVTGLTHMYDGLRRDLSDR